MPVLRAARREDGPALGAFAGRVFSEVFGTLYAPEDLGRFVEEAFGPAGLPAQIASPDYEIRVAEQDGAITGFAKIGPVVFPGDWGDRTIELHQLYVAAEQRGGGIAPRLMDWALDRGRARGYDRMVLSVYVDNIRAQRFYARYGFAEIGRYEFRVGNQIDDDRIWARDL
ncbi:GNAT family N-acetyltransferase [Stakelama tenebrarum]|uniref:GNAT family N-acetyltransferase n=1 Tax=Stakelama tenebrarum TaxID=2711215 RepID=A0A6G6Y9S5_9SPHN|nr:GNAT family N-acetyltransferase [Sphingosinithalassobacter tenebrarum]QIG81669.1 GNAT family N-acetyltransferase [Sphingosinithalassobacter tenebrarum]